MWLLYSTPSPSTAVMRMQLYSMLHSNTAFNIDLQLKLEEEIMLFHV